MGIYDGKKDYLLSDAFRNDPITIQGEIDKESLDKLKKTCEIPEDIKIKIVEIYNYMAKTGTGKIVFQFETGIKMICEIDDSEWKNKPKIDLSEVLKNDE